MNSSLEQGLRGIVGDRIIVDRESLTPFTHDEYATDDYHTYPDAVVKPASEEEAASIVKLCARLKRPLTTRGGGTGLVGGCIPSPGGVVMSMELLNTVLDKDPANLTITVQAGVTLKKLYEEVEGMSLYFPPHPGDEGAHVGGAVATNAGGSRAVKYGTVRRFVQGLRVILASGEILELGGKYIKSSSGYHMVDLMVGSEGTLGVITAVTLSLLPPVGSVQTLIAPFTTVEQAIEAVPGMLKKGYLPCAVEFVEHSATRAAERLMKMTWPARIGDASLMIIIDGRNDDDTLAQAEAIGSVLEEAGALDILIADQKAKQEEILQLRSNLYEGIRPATVELYDACVPRSQIAGHVTFLHDLEKRIGAPLPTFGHAADGNVHSHFLRQHLDDGVLGAEVEDWRRKRELASEAIYADVASRGGVISGEHGIGLTKRKYLPMNLNAAQLSAMRAIKKAMDPDGILNPGKIFELG